MALQDILQKILDEAAVEVKNIDTILEEEKKQLKLEINKQTTSQQEELGGKKEKALLAIKMKTDAMARRDVKSLQQEARRKVITKAMEKFLEHLVVLPTKEYQQLLEKLVEPLSGEGTLFVPSERVEITKKVAPKGFTVEPSNEIEGGFLAKLSSAEVDCSFHGIVFSEFRNEVESFFAQKLNLI
jgi:vacuolar-type H+-ATPase subunit E/Vma4